MMKLFAGLLVLAALAMGAAMVVGGRMSLADSRPVTLMAVASPADSFVIHDAPAAPPAAPAPATPASDAPASDAPAAGAPGGLDAAIERLRAAKPADADTTAPVSAPGATAKPDPLLAGPNPAPSILAGPTAAPLANWPSVTSQGARWRGGRDSLVLDMGGGRTATVFVDPAFQALPQDAASARVDFLKQTILEAFPPGSSQFRFARDGSVSLVR